MKVSLKHLSFAGLLGLVAFNPLCGDERGRELFMVNCQTCHGADGKGGTVVGQALKARDLTSEPFKQGATLGAITNTILKGVPGTGMAGFPYLNKADRMSLARYVISIHKPEGSSAPVAAAPTKSTPAKAPAIAQIDDSKGVTIKNTKPIVSDDGKTVTAVVQKPQVPKKIKADAINKLAATPKAAPVKTQAAAASAPAKAASGGDSEIISKGRQLYKSNGCNSCHGDDLLAATPTGMALKARNLVKEPYKQGATIEGIMGTLKKGVPGTAMAAFPQISDEDSKAISAFIVAVREGKAPAIDASAEAAGSAGGSNKVSISYAMSLLAVEPRVAHSVSFASDSKGAKVFAENCASCHGANGQSDRAAKMISPAPFYRVQTQPLLGYNGYWITDKAAFTKLVTEGIPGRLMPGNGTLTKAEIDALYDYFRECFTKAAK